MLDTNGELIAQQSAEEAKKLLVVAESYQIDSPEMYQAAGDDLKKIKGQMKDVEESRKSITKPLDEAKAKIMSLFKAPMDFLENAERILKGRMINYQNEQERLRREEEARLREIARKEQERLQKLAEKAAAKGQEEKAQALATSAASMPTPIIAPTLQKVSGISTRENWRAEVTDKKALIKAVADGLVPDIAIEVNMSFLNNQAKALKEALAYPGVKSYSEQVISSRAA